jgi:hypothetical protein
MQANQHSSIDPRLWKKQGCEGSADGNAPAGVQVPGNWRNAFFQSIMGFKINAAGPGQHSLRRSAKNRPNGRAPCEIETGPDAMS